MGFLVDNGRVMESSFRWSNNKMRGNRWSRRTLTMVIFLFWQSRVNVASLWLDYWLWFCNGDEWACGLWWYTSASTYTGPPLFVADQLNHLTKPPINIDLTWLFLRSYCYRSTRHLRASYHWLYRRCCCCVDDEDGTYAYNITTNTTRTMHFSFLIIYVLGTCWY